MFHRCILLFAVASLTVLNGAAWASSIFVDVSAQNANTTAWPTGVAPGGAVIAQQGTSTTGGTPWYYSGGTNGSFTNVGATWFGAINVTRARGSAMNDSGQVTVYHSLPSPGDGWLYSGGTAAAMVNYPGATTTWSLAIDDNGDLGGQYTSGAGIKPYIYVAGQNYTLNAPPDNPQTPDVTALNTPVTAGGVTTGQAAGEQWGGGPTGNHAVVWSYTINSSGTMTSQTPLDLQTSLPVGHRLSDALNFSGSSSLSSQGLAINSSGTVVVGARENALLGGPNSDTNYLLYNMTAQTFTPLTDSTSGANLMMYEPIASTSSELDAGHDQAINNAGYVVGYTGTQGSTWRAAIWQPNGIGGGTITDLNTTFASELAGTGFTLNCASAIDNNGDIAGWGTDSSSNTYQAFVIYNAVPEPGTLMLFLAGAVGLLAYAWQKRK